MTGLTRRRAAEVIAEHFGTQTTVDYRGGVYSTYTCRDSKGRTWQVMSDSSIRESASGEQVEVVTPILTYDDIEDLQEVLRQLRHAGAISNPDHGCGVHIHIGADGHTPQSLRNLANIMAAHEQLLSRAIHIADHRTRYYCRPVDTRFLEAVNAQKPTTMEALADLWYGTQGADFHRDAHYNSSRYHMLNYHATFTKGTIEFRLFQFDNPHTSGGKHYKGGLHAGRLKAYIQLALALSQTAKTVRSASPKKLETDNPKYAMRCWLLRLGFIGGEFATARDLLTKKLPGDTAWRHGRPQRTEEAA